MSSFWRVLQVGPIKEREDGTAFGDVDYHVYYPEALTTDSELTPNGVTRDMLAVRNLPGLTPHVSTHPQSDFMVLKELSTAIYQGKSKHHYIVTGSYDSRVEIDRRDADRANWPILVSIRAYSEQRPAYWDTFGNPLTNSAGDYYEGLTNRVRLRAYDVTAYFDSIPDQLFELVGTVNSSAITIHGRTFPAGTALLADASSPKQPEREEIDVSPFYKNWWPIDYNILIDLQGWVSILPDRGYHEYIYQTRADTESEWEVVTGVPAWTGDTTTSRRIKVRLSDDNDLDTSAAYWLDRFGRSVGNFSGLNNITVATTAGSGTVTTADTVSVNNIGAMVSIAGAGTFGRRHHARITAVTGSGPYSLTVEPVCQTTDASTTLNSGGASCKIFQIDDLADWTGLPLPNNHTATAY